MANRYEQVLRDEWDKFKNGKELLPNILLLGATGCGKSSLVNTIFHRQLAPVNDVARGTDDFKTYWGKDYDIGVNLIDSRGYELEDGKGESYETYIAAINNLIENNRKKKPLEQIHIVWFCISILGSVQEYDLQVMKKLLQEPALRGRVGVVLTKCDEDDKEGSEAKVFKTILADHFGVTLPVFEVSTDLSLDLEMEDLIDWSASQLTDIDLQQAFIASQMISLKQKREMSAKRIAIFCSAAAAIGATPIPLSDAALLTPLQLSMATMIIHIYGIDDLATISKSVVGDFIIANLGKSIAGGLLKLFPGIGSFLGGMINGGVAAFITAALGFAISEICYETCKKIANGQQVDFSSLFDKASIQELAKQFMKTHKPSDIVLHLSQKDQEKAKEYASEYQGKYGNKL